MEVGEGKWTKSSSYVSIPFSSYIWAEKSGLDLGWLISETMNDIMTQAFRESLIMLLREMFWILYLFFYFTPFRDFSIIIPKKIWPISVKLNGSWYGSLPKSKVIAVE